MKKSNKLYIVIFVFVFLLASASVTYAVFKDGTRGSSTLALANWSVTLEQTGIDNNLTVVPGIADATYTLKVKSLSDVDIKYDVVVSNLPAGISVSVDDTDNSKFVEEDNGVATIANAGVILYSASNKTNTHTLIFRGTNNANEFVNNRAVTVSVVAKQVIGN